MLKTLYDEQKIDIKNAVMKYTLIIFCILAAYLFGIYSHSQNLWPVGLLLELKESTLPRLQGRYDEFGRLVDYPNKRQTPCPAQTADTAVLLVIGQSNSANHAEKKFITQFPGKVVNYFNGKCYQAASPLLGATGEDGEFVTPLADKLIQLGHFQSVVIIASGIGGTPITRWQRDGDLNEMLLTVIRQVEREYKITHVIWHQGEDDYIKKTSTKNYIKMFNSLLDTLRENDVNAPIYLSIATKCGANTHWDQNNPTSTGQHQLVDSRKIFLGVNTDVLVSDQDRRADRCHFAETGQLKTADSIARSITKDSGK
ncbi:MAG: hypothetical protein DM484_15410 [Candidatus Methylumidiphilus alinenensis]|uniref:Sialate O-acetylesterase domain-containing protein n=1 Tax=Candidatus Methylumidiphilus alinenensis TaxID=2202197 RepID=A0A2W4QYB6_9GAMM|nr:MAG: hypothetical protein DM484_15410 [Candidatus Methylumidiphilus alinenensis]